MSQDFDVLTVIGRRYNSTSHRIGQLLKQHGYRDENGEPTEKARGFCWVKRYEFKKGRSNWKWNVEKVINFLDALEAKNPGTITPKKIPRPRKK
jgi:hypothetical protein